MSQKEMNMMNGGDMKMDSHEKSSDEEVKDGSLNVNYDPDEYEAYLNELEREYEIKKLLKKYRETKSRY